MNQKSPCSLSLEFRKHRQGRKPHTLHLPGTFTDPGLGEKNVTH